MRRLRAALACEPRAQSRSATGAGCNGRGQTLVCQAVASSDRRSITVNPAWHAIAHARAADYSDRAQLGQSDSSALQHLWQCNHFEADFPVPCKSAVCIRRARLKTFASVVARFEQDDHHRTHRHKPACMLHGTATAKHVYLAPHICNGPASFEQAFCCAAAVTVHALRVM